MISYCSKRGFFFLLVTFWLWSAQGWASQAINYKLVPNLEPMKD